MQTLVEESVLESDAGCEPDPLKMQEIEEPLPPESDIALLAYRLWEERGHPEGSPEVDWFEAEHQLHFLAEEAKGHFRKRDDEIVSQRSMN